MAVQALNGAASGSGATPSSGGTIDGTGSSSGTASGSGDTTGPPTLESISQINANGANTLDFQNQTKQAMAMWQARIAIDSKCWDLLTQVIQSLER